MPDPHALALFIPRFLAGFFILAAAFIGLFTAAQKFKTSRLRKRLAEDELSSNFIAQFNKRELDDALSGYVVPHCSPSDPANREGEEFLADTRESIFDYMDRNATISPRSYHLLLADTGMGKTSFCLNYYSHLRRNHPELNVCLLSLASKGTDNTIRRIKNKSDTVLIIDALDEDGKAQGRGKERLSELLEVSADYKMVVITCRSQYFISDDSIPRETPLPVLVPRQLGQSPVFSLVRSYISPFGKKEIEQYITRQFPIYYPWRLGARKRARGLIARVPDLAHRPMLLERLPELAKKPTQATELYELYDTLVDGWLDRESRWINGVKLRTISIHLALRMYSQYKTRHGRMKPDEIEMIATRTLGESPDWRHLTARSLLNRDSKGNYKFAHKSILEFLIVKAACEGENQALQTQWTPFMKELFVSWGHSSRGKGEWRRAQEMLRSDEGRENVVPLFDMLGMNAVRGLPDFRRCTERRQTSTGTRLAPASWRASSIEVYNLHGRGVYSIKDCEYNLLWSFIPKSKLEDQPPVTFVEVLRLLDKRPDLKLPSYEQFVSLVEGLYRIGNLLIPEATLFAIQDKPARNEYFLVQINSEVSAIPGIKPIDRRRRIEGTGVYVTCYKAGLSVSHDQAMLLRVGQLYVVNDSSLL